MSWVDGFGDGVGFGFGLGLGFALLSPDADASTGPFVDDFEVVSFTCFCVVVCAMLYQHRQIKKGIELLLLFS